MNKVKKWIASPAVTIGALALAVILLGFSAIGGTRAALTYRSENYVSTMQLHELDVILVENEVPVPDGELLAGSLIIDKTGNREDDNEPFKPGAKYREHLAVTNPSKIKDGVETSITQYVRVTIQKYWLNADGEKSPELNPNLIGLELSLEDGWIRDDDASTDERTVLYYRYPLEPGYITPDFAKTLCINSDVQVTVTAGDGGSRTYVYNNAEFRLEVKVDAVQDHNAADAILSAWGRKVTISNDDDRILSLS